MVHLKFTFITFQCLIVFARAGYIQDKLYDGKIMVLTRFDGQCRDKNVPVQSIFRGLKYNPRSVFITNHTLIVKEDNLDRLKLTLTIERCSSRENPDTCEEFHKQKDIDYCQAINPDNLILNKSPVSFPFVPKLKCPVTKGIYHAYNHTLDFTPFIIFGLEDWYWKCTAEVYSSIKNKLIYCLHLETYLALKAKL